MTLNQALEIINGSESRTGGKSVHFLACGCEPLHLSTFFRAHLLNRLPDIGVDVRTGLYGDLLGNLTVARESPATATAVVLEWSDLDPRLGLRASGGWSAETKSDIVAGCPVRFSQFEVALEKLASRMPVVLAPPSLPLPPIGNTVRGQFSVVELELEQQLAAFLVRVARIPGLRLVRVISGESPVPAELRLDARMELLAGFPYTITFASQLAGQLAAVLHQPTPKKGLITDLDETLWSGIVGEIGVEGVSWQQESHTQAHGLYQQMLGHLASCGVLLSICSKNELSTVHQALARADLFLSPDSLFPVCAGWGPKSGHIGQILRAWNINEDAVVFVDDNPMELEEVKRAFPRITCLRFQGKDPSKVWGLLAELRELFGKPVLMEEDRLRQASIRSSAQLAEMGEEAGSPDFLRTLAGTVTIDWGADPSDKRPLELINKTNQFNLNGRRIAEGEWQRCMEDDDAILGVVSYKDKFGPLGKVAVLLGARTGGGVKVSHWVMSCRAFSRRLEHHTLDALFEYSGASEIAFAFEATERNQPLQEYFSAAGIGPDARGTQSISRELFISHRGILPHEVVAVTRPAALQTTE